jgi:hypothetical protein
MFRHELQVLQGTCLSVRVVEVVANHSPCEQRENEPRDEDAAAGDEETLQHLLGGNKSEDLLGLHSMRRFDP